MSKTLTDFIQELAEFHKKYDHAYVNMPCGISVSGNGDYYLLKYALSSSYSFHSSIEELVIEGERVLNKLREELE